MLPLLEWERVKGELRTFVHPFGIYNLRKFGRMGKRRVYLNNEPTQFFGTEKECQHTVQRIVNQLELGRVKR